MNNKVPHTFKWIINTLKHNGATTPLIAGGAVRDLYFKRERKDIDVFITEEDLKRVLASVEAEGQTTPNVTPKDKFSVKVKMSNETALKTMFNAYAVKRLEATSDNSSEYYDRTGLISKVFQVKLDYAETVEIVVLTVEPMEYFNTYFDLGICKAYFNGSKLHYSPDFMNDVNNRTISIVGQMDELELYRCLRKHTARMQLYFPGYDVRIDPQRVLAKK